MKINVLKPEDVDSAVQHWTENWEQSGDSSPTEEDTQRLLRVLHGYTSCDQVCCYVAKDGQETVGFITGSLSSHPVMEGLAGEIEELYVRPQYRESGAGADLVRHTMSFLLEKGASVLRTHIDINDEESKEFWERLGWLKDLRTFSLYSDA